MVAYGKSFSSAQRSGWENAYIDYEQLKSILSAIEECNATNALNGRKSFSFPNEYPNEYPSEYDLDEDAEFDRYSTHPNTSSTDWIGSFANTHPAHPTLAAHKLASFHLPARAPFPRTPSPANVPNGPPSPHRPPPTAAATHRSHTDQKIATLASRFLGLLQSEIEKVSLFALSRTGDLSDTIGALRFGDSTPLSPHPPAHLDPPSSPDDTDDSDYNNSDSDGPASPILKPTGAPHRAKRAASEPPKVAAAPSLSGPRHHLGNHHFSHHHLAQHPPTSFYSNSSIVAESQPMFTSYLGDDASLIVAVDEADAYTHVGTELLHLLRFIVVNAMACRKILKKHDKLLNNKNVAPPHTSPPHPTNTQPPTATPRLSGGADAHLRALCNGAGVSAITASLLSALNEFQTASDRAEEIFKHAARVTTSASNGGYLSLKLEGVNFSPLKTDKDLDLLEEATSTREAREPSLLPLDKLKNTIAAITTVRHAAGVAYYPFEAFLCRRALTRTGSALGDMGGASVDALAFLLKFDPESASQTPPPLEAFSREGSPSTRRFAPRTQKRVNEVLNLLALLMYTTNYYIVSPTANSYAELLHARDASFGSVLIGAASTAALLAAFLYSVWTTRFNLSFKSALSFSAGAGIVGNVLYAYALTPESLNLAYVGRFVVGLSSAEVANRQFIAVFTSKRELTRQCAWFVAASAIGMSLGPLIAGILDSQSGRDLDVDINLFGGIILNHVTMPGWIMALLWGFQIVLVQFCFFEDERAGGGGVKVGGGEEEGVKVGGGEEGAKIFTESSNLLGADAGETGDQPTPLEQLRSTLLQVSDKARTYRIHFFSNKAFPVMLFLFFLIELTDEILINSVALITRRYFGWHGAGAGFLIASLMVWVLPANYIVNKLAGVHDERDIARGFTIFCVVSVVLILNFSVLLGYPGRGEDVSFRIGDLDDGEAADLWKIRKEHLYNGGWGLYQYVVCIGSLFMGTIMLEGIVTSILAKSAPRELEGDFFNAGLLATLAGGGGRVLGDACIVVGGELHRVEGLDFVNCVFVQVLMLFSLGLYLINRFYTTLDV